MNDLTGAGTVTTTASARSTLTVAPGDQDTFGGSIQDGSGSVAVVMNGSGTLSYSCINTYTGGTTVNSGAVGVVPGVGSMVCDWNGSGRRDSDWETAQGSQIRGHDTSFGRIGNDSIPMSHNWYYVTRFDSESGMAAARWRRR